MTTIFAEACALKRTESTPSPIIALPTALTLILLGVSAFEVWLMLVMPHAISGNDFKHLWLGAYLLHFGRDPYDSEMLMHAARNFRMATINPYVYLPTTGLLLRPLVALGYPTAQVWWLTFNWALAWAVVLAGPTWMRLPRAATARLAGAAFLAGGMPFFRDLAAGQMNVPTAALLMLAAGALVRRRDGITGAALAVGFAWKIAPLLPLAALVPLRRPRAVLWGVALCAAALGVSLWLYGAAIHREALAMIGQMGYGHSTWTERGADFYRDPFNQSPGSLLQHLFTENPYTTPWAIWPAGRVIQLTLLVSLALAAAWGVAWWKWRKKKSLVGGYHDAGMQRLFLASTLLMLLLPSLMWDHYAVQALPALLWLFGSGRALASLRQVVLALIVIGALALPSLPTLPVYHAGAGILMMSLRLWALLGLYFWMLQAGTGENGHLLTDGLRLSARKV